MYYVTDGWASLLSMVKTRWTRHGYGMYLIGKPLDVSFDKGKKYTPLTPGFSILLCMSSILSLDQIRSKSEMRKKSHMGLW